jgi:hypothetical protein
MSEVTSISIQFDIFMHRPIQTAVLGTVEKVYKPMAPAEQNDMEFFIPGDSYIYIDLDMKLYFRGKMVSSSGKDVDLTGTIAVANKLLHSLFYNYRAYLQSRLTYGTHSASSRLSNS